MALVFLGAALTGLNIWKSAWLLAIGGEALTALGLVAFSLGALAGGMRALWKWLPLILAPVYLASFSTTSSSLPAWAPAHTPEWLAVIYGLGWVILGFVLPAQKRYSDDTSKTQPALF
jgi:hypothetical protein